MSRNPFTPGRTIWRDLLTNRPSGVPDHARFWCRRGCGDWWDTDPRLSVPCPSCQAPEGAPCKRPSEHTVWRGGTQGVHAARRTLAWERHPCACDRLWLEAQDASAPCETAPSSARPMQSDLFAGVA